MNRQSIEIRFWQRVDKRGTGDCWNWTAGLLKGYGQVGRNSYNEIMAHRLSYVFENGPIPKGMCVLHRCDNPLCVNPGHLWLGTTAENNADCQKKGRHKFGRFPGSLHPKARLSESDVLAIRASTAKVSEIAANYGIKPAHASSIRQRYIWKHI